MDANWFNRTINWTTLSSGTVPAGLEPPNPAEAVVVASLAPGSYTAVLRSADGAEGNALWRALRSRPGQSPPLRNISTRGEVGTGDDVTIGGFIIGGIAPTKIMVRAIGPSLAAFGVYRRAARSGSGTARQGRVAHLSERQLASRTSSADHRHHHSAFRQANPPSSRHWHPAPTPRSCTMPAPPKA